MNKVLLLAVTISFCLNVAAQTNVYHPFPTSDAEWRDINALCDDPITLPAAVWDYHYWLCGDTIVNNLTYHKLCSELTTDDETYYSWQLLNYYNCGSFLNGALREDSLRRIFYYDFYFQTESLMYDFSNLTVGSSLPITMVNTDSTTYISSIDSILIGSTYRKAYRVSDTIHFFYGPDPHLIEGVGFTTGLFFLQPGPGVRNVLLCYNHDQQLQFTQGFTMYHQCGTMLSVNENVNAENVEVIPNPTTGAFTIDLKNKKKKSSIEIYNLQGKKLFSSEVFEDEKTIDEKFSSGIYFVKVFTGSNQFVKKIIVE
jgi:hypothetical protein